MSVLWRMPWCQSHFSCFFQCFSCNSCSITIWSMEFSDKKARHRLWKNDWPWILLSGCVTDCVVCVMFVERSHRANWWRKRGWKGWTSSSTLYTLSGKLLRWTLCSKLWRPSIRDLWLVATISWFWVRKKNRVKVQTQMFQSKKLLRNRMLWACRWETLRPQN